MEEQELEQQVAEAQSVVAKAEKLINEHKAFDENVGIGNDLFAEVLASDNFTPEVKAMIKEERAKAIAELEVRNKVHARGESSRIASHHRATKI